MDEPKNEGGKPENGNFSTFATELAEIEAFLATPDAYAQSDFAAKSKRAKFSN